MARSAVVVTLILLLSACDEAAHPGGGAGSLERAQTGFTFAVIGDTPYEERDAELFPDLVADLNAVAPPFVIHVGDIKAGGAPCADEVIRGRAAMYEAFTLPFVYTPGDNEWTDCHRHDFAPLERLQFLRNVFYLEDRFASPAGLVRQSASEIVEHREFVENARWTTSGDQGMIYFATVHVVGSANGREAFDGRVGADDAEVDRRDAANTAWLDETFARARADSAAAVVIAAHADPGIRFAYQESSGGVYDPFLRALERGVRSFDGPVVLLQGDTHSCLFDQPPFGPSAEPTPNFWRFRVAGGGNQVGWFAVTVDPAATGPDQIRVESHMFRGSCRI